MVDTNDQSNAIVYCVWYLVCQQCQHIQWKLLGWLLMSLHAACSLYRQCRHTAHPGSCKTCFFCIPVFGGESFLIFPIIDLIVDLKLICIFGLSDLVNPLIFANIYPEWHIYSLWGLLFQFHGQLALKSHWVKMCFFLVCIDSVNITNYIEITRLVMPKPVYLLTVQLLDWSNMGQVRAIRHRWVWGSWYPSI